MTYLPSATEAKRRRDTIREIANRLDDATIDELLRRAKEPSGRDGMPQSTLGGGGSGGNISNPTLNAVLANAGGQEENPETGEPATADTWADQANDPVYDAIAGIFAQLAEATGVLRAVDRSRDYVFAKLRDANNLDSEGRVMDICAGCNEPTIKVKRLDGQPYHHPDPIGGESQPQCWWIAYRAKGRDREAC